MSICKYCTPAKRCAKLINNFEMYRNFFCERSYDFNNCEKYLTSPDKRGENIPVKIKYRR
jgi:hypothetical protein